MSFVLLSCSTIHIQFRRESEEKLIISEKRLNYLFWGLKSSENIQTTRELCGSSDLVDLTYYSDVWAILANYLTIGIWSPKKLEYRCSKIENTDATI